MHNMQKCKTQSAVKAHTNNVYFGVHVQHHNDVKTTITNQKQQEHLESELDPDNFQNLTRNYCTKLQLS